MDILRRLGIVRAPRETERVRNSSYHLLVDVAHTVGTSDRGLPEVRLDLVFAHRPGTTNPEMSLAVLLDRGSPRGNGGSTVRSVGGTRVADIFATTPRYFVDAPVSILSHVATYGAGYDLAFYDDDVKYAGTIHGRSDLQAALQANPPRDHHSYLAMRLQEAIQRLRSDRDLYLLVCTKQLFLESAEVAAVLQQQQPDGPSAVRLHIIDAGTNMSAGDLHQVRSTLAGLRAPPVYYQYAHQLDAVNRNRYPSPREVGDAVVTRVVTELERAFLGISRDVTVGEDPAANGAGALLRVGNLSTNRWYEGSLCAIGFVPMRARLALEFAAAHPATAAIVIRYFDGFTHQEIPLQVPLAP